MLAARARATALTAISLALAEAGDKEQASATFKQAIDVAQNIEPESNKADTLESIASILAEAGDGKQALEVALEMEDGYDKAQALRTIATALATDLEDERSIGNRSTARRMKAAFTPQEQQLAKQLVEAFQASD